MFNAVLERIHQVLGKLVCTYNITQNYIDKFKPRSGILTVAELKICSITNSLEYYSPGQFIFGRDMILPIELTVDWELIHQRKQMQINKDNIR